jgi:hypothetical protein
MTQQIDGLVSRAMSAQITRRKMLQGAAALGVGAAALGAFGGGVLTPLGEASASPLDSDLQILNYALTLEYLEAAAYKAINDSGVLATIYGGRANTYFQAFGAQEANHRDTLISTIKSLGGTPVTAPTRGYNLSPVPTDAAGVLSFFQVVESVGASAYLGAAASIKNPDILEAALSIHAVEAEHASALAQLIAPGTALFAPDAFAIPRTPDQVFQNVAPFFVPSASPFPDVTAGTQYSTAILYLYGLGIVRGDQDGFFRPTNPLLRAQMAGMVARAFLWADENHSASFTDQGTVDNELWNDANVLSYYNVARGYTTTMFDPLTPVLNVQDISFVTRAMVTKGFWDQVVSEDGTMYPNVPASSGHRLDLATFLKYAGLVPGTTSATANWDMYTANATRAFSAQVIYLALMTINKGQATH